MAKKVTKLNSDYVYPRAELAQHPRLALMNYAEARWGLPRNKAKAITDGHDMEEYAKMYGDVFTCNCETPDALIDVIIWPTYQRDGHAGTKSLKAGAPTDPDMGDDGAEKTPEQETSAATAPENGTVAVGSEEVVAVNLDDKPKIRKPRKKEEALAPDQVVKAGSDGTLDGREFGALVAQLVKVQTMLTDMDGRLSGMSTRSIEVSGAMTERLEAVSMLAEEQAALLHHVVDNVLPQAFRVVLRAVLDVADAVNSGSPVDAEALHESMENALIPSGIGEGGEEVTHHAKEPGEDDGEMEIPIADLLDEEKYGMDFIVKLGSENFGLDLRGMDRVQAVNAIQIQLEG